MARARARARVEALEDLVMNEFEEEDAHPVLRAEDPQRPTEGH